MEFNIDTGLTAVGTLVAIGIAWGMQKANNQKQDEKIKEILDQMSKMWLWKDGHEADASNKRVQFQKEIGEVHAQIAMMNGQYSEIKTFLINFGQQIQKIENRLDDLIQKRK